MSFYKFLQVSTNFIAVNLIVVFLFLPFFVFAQEGLKITPTLIEKKAKARDLLEFSIKISNPTDSTIRFYPLVKDISDQENLDKTVSLAEWIEIFRGRIEFSPKEEKEIPFSVQVNLNAKPGKYYATIIFARGSTQPEAEENALKFKQAQLLLNIEVQEHIIERAQIKNFQAEKNLFFNFPIQFFLEIENIGNKEIIPSGSIHIYDKKGEEVANIELIQLIIAPTEKKLLTGIWQADKGFGRFKAQLLAEYGEKEKRDLQDVVYFWIFPWHFLIIFVFGVLFLLFLSTWFIFKKIKGHHYQKPRLDKILDLRR